MLILILVKFSFTEINNVVSVFSMLIFIGLPGEASVIIVESVSSEVVSGACRIISVSSSISATIGVVEIPPPPPPPLLPPPPEDDEQVPQSVAQEEQDSEALQVP